MNVDTRRHLTAAKYGRLYDAETGGTFIRSHTVSGHTSRRAQLKIVEQLLADGWIVRLSDGRYPITDLGEAALAADRAQLAPEVPHGA
ncbi:hypothetical protein Rhe02_54350 [Rhizocola hellebori]|uniref:Uncharacterized protein n=1 Tax=Rhizocola hellebori TaxID=1392758 RepID=A0A8J3QAR6_9ACTN|nr:hypothetical protein [Rhizocola hellebori]GIH07368.1 hypothetical protein Rhe02_54350 [Rhizocola hellebori]